MKKLVFDNSIYQIKLIGKGEKAIIAEENGRLNVLDIEKLAIKETHDLDLKGEKLNKIR